MGLADELLLKPNQSLPFAPFRQQQKQSQVLSQCGLPVICTIQSRCNVSNTPKIVKIRSLKRPKTKWILSCSSEAPVKKRVTLDSGDILLQSRSCPASKREEPLLPVNLMSVVNRAVMSAARCSRPTINLSSTERDSHLLLCNSVAAAEVPWPWGLLVFGSETVSRGNGGQQQGGNWAQVARGSCPQSTCPSFPSVKGGHSCQVFSVRQCQGRVVVLTQPPDPLLTSLSRQNKGQS